MVRSAALDRGVLRPKVSRRSARGTEDECESSQAGHQDTFESSHVKISPHCAIVASPHIAELDTV